VGSIEIRPVRELTSTTGASGGQSIIRISALRINAHDCCSHLAWLYDRSKIGQPKKLSESPALDLGARISINLHR
jgi:hypothetical protein